MDRKPRVDIETSVVGFLSSRPSSNVHVASKQVTTAEWWEAERPRFELHVSRIVVDEVSAGDPRAAKERLDLIAELPRLASSDAALELAEALMRDAGLPPKAEAEAAHMALAAVHGMDYLLTWNCKHIANAVLRPNIVRIVLGAGYQAPIMCMPEELLHV